MEAIGENESKIYVNSERTTSTDLEDKLQLQLKARSLQPVYVIAESNVLWRDVVKVVDVVQGQQGKVMLVTRRLNSQNFR